MPPESYTRSEIERAFRFMNEGSKKDEQETTSS